MASQEEFSASQISCHSSSTACSSVTFKVGHAQVPDYFSDSLPASPQWVPMACSPNPRYSVFLPCDKLPKTSMSFSTWSLSCCHKSIHSYNSTSLLIAFQMITSRYKSIFLELFPIPLLTPGVWDFSPTPIYSPPRQIPTDCPTSQFNSDSN